MNPTNFPKHIAIIMDGNGRWAKKNNKIRTSGHKAGAKSVTKIVEFCTVNNIPALTLFAFSTENWLRPKDEVNILMNLFLNTLKTEVKKIHENNIKFQIIGNTKTFPEKLQNKFQEVEKLTENNQGLRLNIAASYGGRWDIVNAVNQILKNKDIKSIDEKVFSDYLQLSQQPEVDLLIRTGGETRISNFLLWQISYSEMYFTKTFWPDFDETEIEKAIKYFQKSERRFGQTSEQLK